MADSAFLERVSIPLIENSCRIRLSKGAAQVPGDGFRDANPTAGDIPPAQPSNEGEPIFIPGGAILRAAWVDPGGELLGVAAISEPLRMKTRSLMARQFLCARSGTISWRV